MIKTLLAAFLISFVLFLWIPMYIGMNGEVVAQDAQENEPTFATSYDVIFDVGEDGITTVTEKISLRNLTSQYYADQFKLTLGSTEIFDIKASDPGGVLEVNSEQKDTSTEISVKFNQQVAGIDKVLHWTLQFKSRDFAQKSGKVWEVRAPKISSTSNVAVYNLTISVPQSFGEPTSISPTPKTKTQSVGRIFLTFDKESLQSSGVSANFGNIQLFDFDLSYHLENPNLVPILTNIALPPDTAYQDVIFERINPLPLNVTVDEDGNYLAWYKLSRGDRLDVSVIGSAKLYISTKVRQPFLDPDLRKKYIQGDKYWEKDHPQITNKLSEILDPLREASDASGNTNPGQEEKAKLIYRYVVNSLQYDSSRLGGDIERLGAATALNNPQFAVCMEFTDLFIALARAAAIPARELNGFAYTQNSKLRPLSLTKDVLHAWPEYWDEKRGWVMVDPTWENTTGGVDYFSKFDLNHFVFAIRGFSSSKPAPAGSYKYEKSSESNGIDTQDVKITLSNTDFLGKPKIDVKFDSPGIIFAGFPSKLKLTIENVGNGLYPSNSFGLSTRSISILDESRLETGPIPAFGKASFDFNLRTKSLFDSYEDEITVFVGEQKFTKVVKIEPFYLFRTVPIVAVGLLALILSIYGVILGTLVYRRRFQGKKSPL